MPIYNYKCSKCNIITEEIVGATTGNTGPVDCKACGAKNTMEKMFSMSGIINDVVGGYEYEYGKKAWRRNNSITEQASILAGDREPY